MVIHSCKLLKMYLHAHFCLDSFFFYMDFVMWTIYGTAWREDIFSLLSRILFISFTCLILKFITHIIYSDTAVQHIQSKKITFLKTLKIIYSNHRLLKIEVHRIFNLKTNSTQFFKTFWNLNFINSKGLNSILCQDISGQYELL